MTDNDIKALQPGKALDWKIAKIMGVDAAMFNFAYEAGNYNYSTDISAAMEVEGTFNQEKVLREDYMIQLIVAVGLAPHINLTLNNLYLLAHASAADRCRAALLALKEIKEG